MVSTTIQVSSITAAMRGKKILEQNGIRAYIGRNTEDKEQNGCGYSLILYDQVSKAKSLLQSSGIRIHSVQQGGR